MTKTGRNCGRQSRKSSPTKNREVFQHNGIAPTKPDNATMKILII
jgi:hypothetical protein